MLTKQDVLADDGAFRKRAAIVRANISGLSAMIKVRGLGFTGIVGNTLLRTTCDIALCKILELRKRPAICYTEEGSRQWLESHRPIATLGPGGVVL